MSEYTNNSFNFGTENNRAVSRIYNIKKTTMNTVTRRALEKRAGCKDNIGYKCEPAYSKHNPTFENEDKISSPPIFLDKFYNRWPIDCIYNIAPLDPSKLNDTTYYQYVTAGLQNTGRIEGSTIDDGLLGPIQIIFDSKGVPNNTDYYYTTDGSHPEINGSQTKVFSDAQLIGDHKYITIKLDEANYKSGFVVVKCFSVEKGKTPSGIMSQKFIIKGVDLFFKKPGNRRIPYYVDYMSNWFRTSRNLVIPPLGFNDNGVFQVDKFLDNENNIQLNNEDLLVIGGYIDILKSYRYEGATQFNRDKLNQGFKDDLVTYKNSKSFSYGLASTRSYLSGIPRETFINSHTTNNWLKTHCGLIIHSTYDGYSPNRYTTRPVMDRIVFRMKNRSIEFRTEGSFSIKNMELILNINTNAVGETINFTTGGNSDFDGFLSTVSVGSNIVTKLRFEYKTNETGITASAQYPNWTTIYTFDSNFIFLDIVSVINGFIKYSVPYNFSQTGYTYPISGSSNLGANEDFGQPTANELEQGPSQEELAAMEDGTFEQENSGGDTGSGSGSGSGSGGDTGSGGGDGQDPGAGGGDGQDPGSAANGAGDTGNEEAPNPEDFLDPNSGEYSGSASLQSNTKTNTVNVSANMNIGYSSGTSIIGTSNDPNVQWLAWIQPSSGEPTGQWIEIQESMSDNNEALEALGVVFQKNRYLDNFTGQYLSSYMPGDQVICYQRVGYIKPEVEFPVSLAATYFAYEDIIASMGLKGIALAQTLQLDSSRKRISVNTTQSPIVKTNINPYNSSLPQYNVQTLSGDRYWNYTPQGLDAGNEWRHINSIPGIKDSEDLVGWKVKVDLLNIDPYGPPNQNAGISKSATYRITGTFNDDISNDGRYDYFTLARTVGVEKTSMWGETQIVPELQNKDAGKYTMGDSYVYSSFGGGTDSDLSLPLRVTLISPKKDEIIHNTNKLLAPSEYHPNGKDLRIITAGTYMDGTTPSYTPTTYNIIDVSYTNDPSNHSLLPTTLKPIASFNNITYW
jgi:hypothetical protein